MANEIYNPRSIILGNSVINVQKDKFINTAVDAWKLMNKSIEDYESVKNSPQSEKYANAVRDAKKIYDLVPFFEPFIFYDGYPAKELIIVKEIGELMIKLQHIISEIQGI